MNRIENFQSIHALCSARLSEEPSAVVPHAGICEGGVEQSASLPQSVEEDEKQNYNAVSLISRISRVVVHRWLIRLIFIVPRPSLRIGVFWFLQSAHQARADIG